MGDEDDKDFFTSYNASSMKLKKQDSVKLQRQGSVDDEGADFFASLSSQSMDAAKRRGSIAGGIIEKLGPMSGSADGNEEGGSSELKANIHGKSVIARIRPFTQEEIQSKSHRIVSVTPGHKLTIINPSLCQEDPDKIASIASSSSMSNESAKVFQFSKCMWSFDSSTSNPREKAFTTQEMVHDAIGKDMVDYAVKGVSVCCFA